MLQLERIHKCFENHVVLKDISLTVKRGEIYGLIGKNGAGKTTTLSIIAGLANATNGICLLDNQPISQNCITRKVGYLPDVPTFFDYLSAGEYISFLLKESYSRHRVKSILDLVKVSPKTRIKTMSRGNKQRLGLAAALANDPEVLLLDEPSSALDPQGRYELSEILEGLKRQGKIIIISSHILTDLESICDKVGFLHNGCIAKTMSKEDYYKKSAIKLIFEEDIDSSIFEGLSAIIQIKDNRSVVISPTTSYMGIQAELCKRLVNCNCRLLYFGADTYSLEDVFKEICI